MEDSLITDYDLRDVDWPDLLHVEGDSHRLPGFQWSLDQVSDDALSINHVGDLSGARANGDTDTGAADGSVVVALFEEANKEFLIEIEFFAINLEGDLG